MKFSIQNLYHYFDDDFGDYDLCFAFDVVITEPEHCEIKNYPLPLQFIEKYIAEKYPEFDKYFDSVRSSLDTWGPQTGRTFEALGEEAQKQYYTYVAEYLLQSDWVPQVFEVYKKNRNLPLKEAEQKSEQIQNIRGELQSMADGLKKITTRSVEFKTKVQRALREITVEIYPEVMNATPEQIKDLQYLYVNDIINIERTLSNYLLALKNNT